MLWSLRCPTTTTMPEPPFGCRSVHLATLSPTGKALELAALSILTDPFSCPVPCALFSLSAKCACIFGPSLHAVDRVVQLCAQGGYWPHRTGHTGYDFARRQPHARCLRLSHSACIFGPCVLLDVDGFVVVVCIATALLHWMSVAILRFDNKRGLLSLGSNVRPGRLHLLLFFLIFTRTECGEMAVDAERRGARKMCCCKADARYLPFF